MNTSVAEEPRLAPPGAGLPAIELFFARRLFAIKRLFGKREAFTEKFQHERAAIRALVDGADIAGRSRRVLIPRLRGLEDSSRHWSVWMTLDHLRITNLAFAWMISTLASGKKPRGVVSTANVKPDPAVGAEVEAAYEASCDELIKAVAGIGDLKTRVKHAHPWFGPLDAAGWHALSATHMGIHRAQIARILAALP